jgi:hypothetical protein
VTARTWDDGPALLVTDTDLTRVLGHRYWSAAFPTAHAATLHACQRIDEGRQAVTFTDADGRCCAAWSE